MSFKKDEVYRCPDPECGCEITVTKGAAPGKGGNLPPRCVLPSALHQSRGM